jgi:transposase
MANPLLVGIDLARHENVSCLLNSQGEEVARRFRSANSRPGTQQLAERLVQVLSAGDFDSVRIAAEATSWYWFPCFQALSQDRPLHAWPVTLYALNPRLPAKHAETFGDLDKTDDNDALVIADHLRTARTLPHPFQGPPPHLALRFLTRYRYHLVHTLAREKQYAYSILYLKASEYQTGRPFADVFGAASRAVITQFATLEQIVAWPLEDLTAFLQTHGKGRFSDPWATAQQLQAVARDSYPLPLEVQPAVDHVLHWSLDLIADLQRQEHQINRAIAELMADIPQTLDSIPGFGPVFTAGILAEIGDIARFDYDEEKVAQFAGLKWRRKQSGASEAQDTPLSKRGDRYLRYYLCEAANAVRMHDAEYAAYYERKYQEVRKHQHRRAIVLTARKLVRLVVRLLTTHERYRPPRRPSAN